jgi:hypothetical protein
MISLEDNEFLLRCSCHSADHLAFLIHEPDDSRGNNLKARMTTGICPSLLDPIQPWWKRIWRALRPNSGRYRMYVELV